MTAPTKDEVRQLFAVHNGRAATTERQARAELFDRERLWVDGSPYRLSDRVWMQRAVIRNQIDEVLKRAIVSGEDSLVTARKLEEFLDPAFAPTRNERGRLVRGQARALVQSAPGRGGMGSTPARRLARTEISRAHSDGTMFAAARTPFAIGWKFNLSGSHAHADRCDQSAHADNGLGQGVYRVGEGPQPPVHPHCRCYVTIVTPDDVNAVVDSLRTLYRL